MFGPTKLLLSLFTALIFTVTSSLFAEEKVPIRIQDYLEEKSNPNEEDIPMEVRRKIISKEWVMRQGKKKFVGLREAGNPHIRDNFLIKKIQDDPERSQVDKKELRKKSLRRVRHGDSQPTKKKVPENQDASTNFVKKLSDDNTAQKDTTQKETVDSDENKANPITWFMGLALGSMFMAALAFYIFRDRKQPAKDAKRRSGRPKIPTQTSRTTKSG